MKGAKLLTVHHEMKILLGHLDTSVTLNSSLLNLFPGVVVYVLCCALLWNPKVVFWGCLWTLV